MNSRVLSGILALSASLCLMACQSELVETPVVKPSGETTKCRLVAHCFETKTVNNGLGTEWGQSDELSVFYQSGSTYVHSRFGYEEDNAFTGEVSDVVYPGDWYAVYPYNSAYSTPSSVSVTIPSVSTQTGNDSMAHLAGPGFPLIGNAKGVASGTDPTLTMCQVSSAAKFVVTNTGDDPIVVTKIELVAPAAISGTFSTDLTASSLVWTVVPDAGSDTVALNVEDGSEIASGASAAFYAGIMPFDFEGEFTIRVSAIAGEEPVVCTKTVSDLHMVFASGVITKVGVNFVADETAPANEAYYVKVTENLTDWKGTYLVVNNEGTKAFGVLSAGASASAVDVTLDGDAILSTPELDAYAVTIIGGETKHTNPTGNTLDAYDVLNSNGKYIYYSTSNFRCGDTNVGTDSNHYVYRHTFMYSNGGVQMRSAGMTNGNSKYYLTYTGGTFAYQKDSESNRVQLYALVEGPVKHAQTLSFAEPSVAWTVGEGESYAIGSTYDMPQTVSGAETTVTYTSSDISVAEIVDNSRVRIKGTGSVTITASAAETDDYKPASATYTLVIREQTTASELDLGTFELVNDTIRPYLIAAASAYSDSDWKTNSIVANYPNGDGGDQNDSGPIYSYDLPKAVLIPMDGYNGASATVSVYNDESRTDLEMTVNATVSNSQVEVFSLIPNRTYWYTATVGGTAVSQGKFATTGLRRYLKASDICSADHANNLRDLGGMQTLDGHTLKYNLIFRGTNMDGTTAAEQAFITGYMGVRADIDLRSAGGSSSSNAHQPLDRNLVTYVNDGFSSFSQISNSKLCKYINAIMDKVIAGEAVYIHCFAGADRTGYICMLLEAVCGVSQKDCSIDFELTSFSCVGLRDRTCKAIQSTYYFKPGMEKLEKTSGSTFQAKATKILTDAGISSDKINAFKAAMIE